MNEGLQILLLGILFQRLHHKNTEFCQKIKFHRFRWLAPENSKNHFFTQRLVKNRILGNRNKKYLFGISVSLTKQNYKRISRNASLKQNILPTS